ncbi:hypothetical protein JQ616_00090 [Bradyrhizobium tropiciagri]|uniref:hypothetical protein n=1 Tax=Bradyrhizobium tropiciagri TaxID=312253 RepID=UPI001BA5A975|nr:hypothetical protein [Bradyrhizobium tropiciagri]MBR0893329.1 hypothetical protein [Bradyrhizobium tropiciagri]
MELPSGIREDMAMKGSSLFVTNFAVAALSIVPLLCGSGRPAWSQPSPLPDISVEAPKHVGAQQKPTQRAAARSARSPQTASTSVFCIGGCMSSFRSGDRPWVGCSWSAGASAYTGCRNIGPGGVPFKSYNQCAETGLNNGWRSGEIFAYCTSLALK